MKLELIVGELPPVLKKGQGYLTNLLKDGIRNKALWYCCHHCGNDILVSDHTITENEDGIITISPSLVCPTIGCSGHFFIEGSEIRES